jgi:hypothetical protein
VSFDPVRLRAAAADRAKAPAGLSAGTGFLVRRQKEQRSVQDARADARARAERIHDALAPVAFDVRRRPPADVEGATLLLDAAFLVERTRAREFAAAARGHAARAEADGLHVVLTGPWPPYNFLSPPPKARRRGRSR